MQYQPPQVDRLSCPGVSFETTAGGRSTVTLDGRIYEFGSVAFVVRNTSDIAEPVRERFFAPAVPWQRQNTFAIERSWEHPGLDGGTFSVDETVRVLGVGDDRPSELERNVAVRYRGLWPAPALEIQVVFPVAELDAGGGRSLRTPPTNGEFGHTMLGMQSGLISKFRPISNTPTMWRLQVSSPGSSRALHI